MEVTVLIRLTSVGRTIRYTRIHQGLQPVVGGVRAHVEGFR